MFTKMIIMSEENHCSWCGGYQGSEYGCNCEMKAAHTERPCGKCQGRGLIVQNNEVTGCPLCDGTGEKKKDEWWRW